MLRAFCTFALVAGVVSLVEVRTTAWADQAEAPCALADFDRDLDVDTADHDFFEACATGPGVGVGSPGCARADLDQDGDVDQSDYGLFQECVGRYIRPDEVIITEFMAVDSRGPLDEDGQNPDWIEIYNSGPTDANLAGWFLTDDPGNLMRWRFPQVTLRRGEHRLVFASGKDKVGPNGELHANFQLDGGGEFLALVKPDGLTIACAFAPQFPGQKERASYGLRGEAVPPSAHVLVATGATGKMLVPIDAAQALLWTQKVFTETGWSPCTTGIGFDRSADAAYKNLLATDVLDTMADQNATLYIRIPFTVADPSRVNSLTLRMKYDDGYIAYINGTRVAAKNPPATVRWDAGASGSHSDAQAVIFEDVDISFYINKLEPGGNILAIHAMNRDRSNGDFLIIPELHMQTAGSGTYRLGEYRYFATPSPLEVNGAGYAGLVADTKFSVNRGFYDQPFEVALATDTPGATIRYTTDSSAPSEANGTVYSGPIAINGLTTLRAAAFKADYLPTNVDTHTYLFFAEVLRQPASPPGFPTTWGGENGENLIPADYQVDPDVVNNPVYTGRLLSALTSIPTVSLVTNTEYMFDRYTGIYSNNSMRDAPGETLWERPVSVELMYADGRKGIQVNAGVQMQGGTSDQNWGSGWKCDKLSMRLVFKDAYGPAKLVFPVYADTPVERFNTLNLDAHMNLTWIHPDAGQQLMGQYVRDSFMADLQNRLGSVGPHNIFVHLYINGLYWGIHELHERPDEDFAADYFGGEPEDYDVLKHNRNTAVNGDTVAYNAMMNLANAGLADAAAYKTIGEQYLDIDNFIDYMITNFYGANEDWAHQNWYATRSRKPGGLFRYHSWDAEHVLKSNVNYNSIADAASDGIGAPTWLHLRLAANAEYRLRFADHVHRHFFNGGQLYVDPARPNWDPAHPERNRPAALYMKRIAEIDPAIIMESARWGDNRRPSLPYTRDVEWMNELNRLLNSWLPQRSAIVMGQLTTAGLYPNVSAPVFSQHGGYYPPGFSLTMSPVDGTLRYTIDGTDPRLAGGAVAPAAVLYAGPIPLNGVVHVKARRLVGGVWSALNEAVFIPGQAAPVRITEVMYHPQGAGSYEADEYEFLELQNTGTLPVNLKDMQLSGAVALTFPDVVLGPGEFIVVYENPAAFESRYGTEVTTAGRYTGKLGNASDTIRLSDAFGQVLLEFTYSDQWHPTTDGDGYSLTVVNPLAAPAMWSDPAQWRPSAAIDGSPGTAD